MVLFPVCHYEPSFFRSLQTPYFGIFSFPTGFIDVYPAFPFLKCIRHVWLPGNYYNIKWIKVQQKAKIHGVLVSLVLLSQVTADLKNEILE